MKNIFSPIKIIFLLITLNILIYSCYFLIPQTLAYSKTLLSPLAINNQDVLGQMVFPNDKGSLETKINILLMGFDGRKGDRNPRCDALHLFSIDKNDKSILITSIPRSTKVTLPDQSENVLANACHIMGHDYVKKQIEEITGEKIHYYVKTGFSQTLGIIRNLGLPTVPTLMYLRNRATGLGDYQRSRNQGVFLKEMIVKYAKEINKIPKPLRYLIFKTIDTNLTYDETIKILDEILQYDLGGKSDNIYQVTITPDYKNFKNISLTLGVNSNWEKDEEYQNLQENLLAYLKNIISRSNAMIKSGNIKSAASLIKTPYSQQLWLQLNDKNERNTLHFEILEIYIKSSEDKKTNSEEILDFITEMELENEPELIKRGEELLNVIN